MLNKTLKNILQEPTVAYKTAENRLDLVALTRKGIPKQALLNLGTMLNLSLKELANLLPVTERTLQRREPETLLGAAVSEQIILIAEVTEKGSSVLGGIEPFKKWLREENLALGGHQPLHLLDTAIGVQLVEEELGKLEYGVYS